MKQVIFFDGEDRENLLPLTYTRPVADLTIGASTIAHKWMRQFPGSFSYHTVDYLQEKFPLKKSEDNLLILGSLLPDSQLISIIKTLQPGDVLIKNNVLLAARCNYSEVDQILNNNLHNCKAIVIDSEITKISYPWDLFSLNDKAIRYDYQDLTQGLVSQKLSPSNTLIGDQLFIEEGAKIEASIINTQTGPVYIAKDAEIMEGSMIRGPFYLGAHAQIKMGAKIYGATTVAEDCRVGGEVFNTVFFPRSSKAHDGFLGNSVIGEWCNLGADTNNSNLKNNYAMVRMWNYPSGKFVHTNLQFAGLIVGDHSKSGINTMFNTGTVIGVSANIFGAGFPRNFIPSYSWGGAQGMEEYGLKKAFETAEIVMKRRNRVLDDVEKRILEHIFNLSAVYRKF